MSGEARRQAWAVGCLVSCALHLMAAVALWPGQQTTELTPVAQDQRAVSGDAQSPASASARATGDEARRALDRGSAAAKTIGTLINRYQWRPERWLAHLAQSTIFATAVGLMTLAFRRNHARVRYWLWFSASVKFLIPFSFFVMLGNKLPSPPAVQSLAAPVATAVTQFGYPFLEPSPPVAILTLSAPRQADWPGLAVLGIWLCGFTGIVCIRLQAWRRVRAAVRASAAIDLQDVFIPPHIRVCAAPGLLEPGVVGFWRPLLLVPAGIERLLTSAQLEAVVTHEICHIRRRDNLTAALHMVVEAVLWFHPMVWWIGSRLVAERERACDEEVLRVCGEPRIYADGILSICKRYIDARLVCVSGVSGSDLRKRIEAIMRNQSREAVTRRKKIALASAALFVVAVPIGIGLAPAPDLRAQSAAAAQPVAFEVASIRANKSPNRGGPFGPQPGGRFVATNTPLRFLIAFAYETSPWNRALDSFLMTGGPDWLNADRFDVNARAAAGDVPLAQMRLMVQSLLVDRFKLRVHHETQERPIYRLVAARSDGQPGAQLRRTELSCAAPGDPFAGFPRDADVPCGYFGMSPTVAPAQSHQAFRGLTMEGLTRRLQSFLGRPVVEATGFDGYYDGDFEFTAEIVLPPPPPGLPNPFEGRVFPSIFSVLPQQLGLRLESARGPVDVLVIDGAEHPTEN